MLIYNQSNNKTTELVCPHCHSKYIVKNGKNKEKQRYKCKNCNRFFVNETTTPVYYSKKDITVGIQYIECLFSQDSIRKAASKCNISKKVLHFSGGIVY